MTIVIVMIATIAIVLGLILLYWIANFIITKSGKLEGKNKKPLTLGKNLIFKTIFFGLYLIFMVCLGLILYETENESIRLFTTFWYQLILLILPSVVFWLWFLTEYVYIIFLKCKIGEKELNNISVSNKNAKVTLNKNVKVTPVKNSKK